MLAGGGRNHRMGLYDAILIKENHIALAGSLAKAVHARPQRSIRSWRSRSSAATSTRSPTRSAPAPTSSCSTTWTPRRCARRCGCATKTRGGEGPSLEASGGVSLETVRGIAETGVDFISVGALTHSAPTLDFSMLIEAYFSRRERRRSLSTRPPVCSFGQ